MWLEVEWAGGRLAGLFAPLNHQKKRYDTDPWEASVQLDQSLQ